MQAQNSTTTVRYIRSSRDLNRFYTVALNPRGYWECECAASKFYRARPCKHVDQVTRGCGLTATAKLKVPTPGPSPARGEGVYSPFRSQDDGVTRGGRVRS